MKGKTFYLCDRRKCHNCQYPTCKHTDNIFHANNFYVANKSFWERDKDEIKIAKEKAYWDVIFLIKDIKDNYKDDEKIKVIDELENKIKEYL